MPKKFSEFLKMTREERDLTQQQLLDTLIEASNEFEKLDLTTLSRWERGVTTPKLTKQLLAARILGSDVATLITDELRPSDKKKQQFDVVAQRTLDRYSKDKSFFTLKHFPSLSGKNELCEKLRVFHVDHLDIDLDADSLMSSNLSVDAFYNIHQELIGHFLYGFVPGDTPDEMLNPTKLADCPFIAAESESHTDSLILYIVSTYSSLAPPRMLVILFILDVLRQHTNISHVVINSHDQEGYSLFDSNAECDVINKGDIVPFGGCKVFGRHYRYAQLKSEAVSILGSKVVCDLVPYTDEFICKLLGYYYQHTEHIFTNRSE